MNTQSVEFNNMVFIAMVAVSTISVVCAFVGALYTQTSFSQIRPYLPQEFNKEGLFRLHIRHLALSDTVPVEYRRTYFRAICFYEIACTGAVAATFYFGAYPVALFFSVPLLGLAVDLRRSWVISR